MAGPLLPSTGHCPPCTHGCSSQAGGGFTPSPTSLPAMLPPERGGPLLPPSLPPPQRTPFAPEDTSHPKGHLSPQKPPVKPLRVPVEQVDSHTAEDAAEPGKLVPFVMGVRAELTVQHPNRRAAEPRTLPSCRNSITGQTPSQRFPNLFQMF